MSWNHVIALTPSSVLDECIHHVRSEMLAQGDKRPVHLDPHNIADVVRYAVLHYGFELERKHREALRNT